MRFTNTVTIARPRADVFGYLARFENIPTWNYAIAQTRQLTPGPVGIGTTYRQLRTVPRRSEESFEVVEFEPDHRLAIRGRLGPLSGDIAYALASSGQATVLTNTCDLSAASPLGLLAPVAARSVRTAVAANLNVLKQLLEARPPASG